MKRVLSIALCLLCLLAGCQPRTAASAAESSRGEPVSHAEPSRPPASQEEEPLREPSASADAEALAPAAPQSVPPEPAASAAEPEFALGASALSEELIARIAGNSWQEDGPVSLEELSHVRVRYLDFEGNTQGGELVVHHSLAQEVADIFEELYGAGFPIGEVSLVEEYGCDDAASMAAGNTSCFNMRRIAGTQRWSRHSWGAAVDINPLQNPYVTAASVSPEGSRDYLDRQDVRPGMIVEGDVCYTAFVSRGWVWGGHWANPDYQHFEKPVA